jgi:glutathione S-transferase
MMLQKPVDEKKVARFQKEMEKCLSEIENIWLDSGKKNFIIGDKISIADLLACCELEQPGNQINFIMVTEMLVFVFF